MNHQVFISYSSTNLKVAQAACHVIEERGFKCWMAPRDIAPGSSYADLIDEAIQSCDVFVLIFSKSSSISKWVRSELNLAFERQAYIIPFRVDDTPLQGSNRLILKQTHWIDAYPQYESKLNELVESINSVLSSKNKGESKSEGKVASESHQSKWKISASPIRIICLLAFAVIAAFLMWLFIPRERTYTYSRDGLNVSGVVLTEAEESVINQILDDMVYIDGGTFLMGNTEKGNEYWVEADQYSSVCHNVKLNGFYISKYELTQEQWLILTGDYSVMRNLSPQNPVDYMSWESAFQVADKLKRLTGLQFSLPTEAQWEYAAKGGSKTSGCIYSGSDNVDDVAWVASFDTLVHRVGLLKPNELGLYDMTGNVAEWCLDYFSEYEDKEQTNPSGPQSGKLRVIRGGSISSDIYNSKVTVREKAFPAYSRRYSGVRLVINLQDNE